MALSATTLTSACAATDTSIVVASASGFAPGNLVKVDQEFMRVSKAYVSGLTILLDGRGLNGGVVSAHPVTSNVTTSATVTDFASAVAANVVAYPISSPSRQIVSYTADGAITLPTPGNDMVAVLNGTTQWDMTLAPPTKDMDGSILTIIGNGKSAHTVTVAGGIGLASTGYTILTFDTGGQCAVNLMACGIAWIPLGSPLSGTLTAVDVAVS